MRVQVKPAIHDGTHPNAGRKKPPSPLKVRAVRLSDDEVLLLKIWGGGDMTAGIRGLIKKAAARSMLDGDSVM